ncbi:RICIN domain-containing protein [Nonomuraea typhae]|uniref:RICIN domain-containing protein n=1 Tax=Nonomuraea typhae TaxID=2603600 RepID=UPI001CA5D115|nr:hypothetical protein [Nonomuraea typhae]
MKKRILTTAAGAITGLALMVPAAAPAQAAGPAALIGGVFKAAELIDKLIKLAGDQKERSEGVEALMEEMRSDTRDEFNIMIANFSTADYSGLPTASTDPDYLFKQVTIGSTRYGVWIFDEDGTFTNKGDGGYLNWRFFAPGGFTRLNKDGQPDPKGPTVRFSESPQDGKHDLADKAQGADWDSDDADLPKDDPKPEPKPDPKPEPGDKPAHGKKVTLKSDNGKTLGPVTLWDKGNGNWEIEPTATGTLYEVVPNKWTVQTAKADHGTKQLWMFQDGDGDGRYSIVNRYNRDAGFSKGGCLTWDNGNLWAIDCNKPNGQLWTLN